MRGAGHVTHMGEIRNAHKILIGKSEGKITLVRDIGRRIILE